MSATKPTNAGQWIEDHMSKLNQYATALKRRDTGVFFDEEDFLNMMSMRIILAEKLVSGFMEQSDAYIFKTAWNEGLMMLRKQRRYEMSVMNVGNADDESENDIEMIEAPEAGLPENIQIDDEQKQLISNAIASLPPISRKVAEYMYAGYKPTEIERMMGIQTVSNYHIPRIRDMFVRFGLQAG